MKTRVLLLSLIFIFSNPLQAKESIDDLLAQIRKKGLSISKFNPKDKTNLDQYSILYYELNKYRRLDFVSKAGHLPRYEKEYEFKSENEIRQYLIDHDRDKQISIDPLIEPKGATELTGEVIWETKQQWSLDWEKKYSEWVIQEVDPEFFIKYNIATDCADVAISLRWIFSRIHYLPMANRLAGTSLLFTNESMREDWQSLKTNALWYKDDRFMTALNYVMEGTYTHSLFSDSYPVLINPTYFGPGVHHLDLHSVDTGHTMYVYRTDVTYEGIAIMYSNVPRIVREMYDTTFYEYANFSDPTQGGFLKIRWPILVNDQWQLKTAQSMPGYSLEQYDEHFVQEGEYFSDAVERRLGLKVPPMQRYQKMFATLKASVSDRVDVVNKGFALCQQQNCDPGTANYENWSTPSRDMRLASLYDRVSDFCQYNDLGDKFEKELELPANQVLIEGTKYPLKDILENVAWGTASSDPRDPILSRWGL